MEHDALPTKVAPRMPIQLLAIAPGEVFGGAERQLLTLLSHLISDSSYRPSLALFHDLELAARARDMGIRVYLLASPTDSLLRSVRNLRRVINTVNPDVYSVHGYRAVVCLALAATGRTLQVVKTEHGAPESNGRLKQRITTQLYRALDNVSTRALSAHIVYVSQDLALRTAREHRGLTRSVIHNGIDPLTRAQTRRPLTYAFDHFNIASVGRLDRVKRLDVAIQAMAHPLMPARAHLHIVGDGSERRALADLVVELGLRQRVSFAGFREDAYDFIAHSDALLLTSEHEGLPYVILESLALGTPVIASDVGGLREAIQNDSTGILVPFGNVRAIAYAVHRLADTSNLREEFRQNAYRLLQTQFSAASMCASYKALFYDMSRRRPRVENPPESF